MTFFAVEVGPASGYKFLHKQFFFNVYILKKYTEKKYMD